MKLVRGLMISFVILFVSALIFIIYLFWIKQKISSRSINELNKYPDSYKTYFFGECSKVDRNCDCEINYLEKNYPYKYADKKFDESSAKFQEARRHCSGSN